MSEQNTPTAATPLSALAERANSSDAWWKADALDQRSELELPTRVLVVLENAGITTVEQLKAAGPNRLRQLEGIGRKASVIGGVVDNKQVHMKTTGFYGIPAQVSKSLAYDSRRHS